MLDNLEHERYGPCGSIDWTRKMLFKVVSPDGTVRYYKVHESDGPRRYGLYTQRVSMGSFLRRHIFAYPNPGYIDEISAFIDLHHVEPDAWFVCKNVWWFYLHIGYDHTKQKFIPEF